MLNVVADGVVSDSDEPLLEGVPVVKKGEKLEGQFMEGRELETLILKKLTRVL